MFSSDTSSKPHISVIITDLDNTLFDWLGIWYGPFKAMLDRLVQDSGISQEVLEVEFKAIHQRYGTSEYSLSLEELPSLIKMHPDQNPAKIYSSAIEAYRRKRQDALRLYPNVLETLRKLKRKGCLVAGYTESMAYYSSYRIKSLSLDGLLDYLFSPEGHDLPQNRKIELAQKYAAQNQLTHTVHKYTPKGKLKPNAKVLKQIMNEIGATPQHSIFIGDSLMKDILMAKSAGVIDVFAKYGETKDRPEYELLRRVTHWIKADVKKEKVLDVTDVEPTYMLEKSFSELLNLFDFIPYIKEMRRINGRKIK